MRKITIQTILKNTELPRQEAILLLEYVLKKPKEWIIAHSETTLPPLQKTKLMKIIKRRQKGEPLAYLLKEKEFFSLPFLVNRQTLIPRPETELLVEKASEIIGRKSKKKIILDIGTGSGCIIISLAYNFKKQKDLFFWANDFSPTAIQVAKKNSRRNQTEKIIDFFSDDLLGEKTIKKVLTVTQKEKFIEIILVANLPYISTEEYKNLEETVKKFEPRSALLSGQNGFKHYQKLLGQLKNFYQHNSELKWKILWEIGYKQKKLAQKEIRKFFPQSQPVFFKDLANKWRVVKFEI